MTGVSKLVQESDVLTMAEVMDFLRFKSRKSVLKAIREQRLPAKKVGGHWRFPRKPLERWVEGGASR
jgi:excisionase family DNA binding protein